MGGVNRLRGVGGTQQLQGLSVRLDGRGESSERSDTIHSSYQVSLISKTCRWEGSQSSERSGTPPIKSTDKGCINETPLRWIQG